MKINVSKTVLMTNAIGKNAISKIEKIREIGSKKRVVKFIYLRNICLVYMMFSIRLEARSKNLKSQINDSRFS